MANKEEILEVLKGVIDPEIGDVYKRQIFLL